MRLRKPCEHGFYDEHDIPRQSYIDRFCPGGEFLAEDTLVDLIAKAVGENFLYPDPNNEGHWMGPGILASREVAQKVLDALVVREGDR